MPKDTTSTNAHTPDSHPAASMHVYSHAMDTQSIYLHQIGMFPRLTQEEELFYATQFKEARKTIKQQLRSFPDLILLQLKHFNSIKNDVRISNYIELSGDREDADIRYSLEDVVNQLDHLFPDSPSLQQVKEHEKDFWEIVGILQLRDSFYDSCLKRLLNSKVWQNMAPDSRWNTVRNTVEQACKKKQEAHDILVERNLRLVISIAKNYQRETISIQDLIQEGNIGLMRAVEKYNPALGHRLSTYASYWIRQAITRALTNHSRTIRISASTLKYINEIRRAEKALLISNGIPPKPEQIADYLNLPHARVRALLKMSQQPISLQAALSENSELADIIPDEDAPQPEEIAARASLRNSIKEAMGNLDEREQFIITKRFGLDDQSILTLTQISETLNLSSERVRQIEANAIKKLRQPQSKKYFEGYEN